MIDLPMTPETCVKEVIEPAFALLPARMDSLQARVLVLAIMVQESGLEVRLQKPHGPAHGLPQFEKGGIGGVLRHPRSTTFVKGLCSKFGIPFTVEAIYAELLKNDIFSAALARLLVWTSYLPLPAFGDSKSAFGYYYSLWKPGKPDDKRWITSYAAAEKALKWIL